MSWIKGFNLRDSSGFVTDAATDTYLLDDGLGNGEQYPTTRNGVTFGYTTARGGMNSRDRNAGNDPRLAGIHYFFPDTPVVVMRVDLPAAGDYAIRCAIGDDAGSGSLWTTTLVVRDNGTPVLTLADETTDSNSFIDATGTNRLTTDWPTSNAAVTATFASQIAELVTGGSTGLFQAVAHYRFDQQASPNVGRPPQMRQYHYKHHH